MNDIRKDTLKRFEALKKERDAASKTRLGDIHREIAELEEILRPTGFFRAKSETLTKLGAALVERCRTIAAGAAEKADRAAAELEAAQTDLDRATRRAEAVKLLRETMLAHRDAARAKGAVSAPRS